MGRRMLARWGDTTPERAVDRQDLATCDDASALWSALMDAKGGGDAGLVRAIEQRMRELSSERRFVHLSDDELRQRIDGLTGNREPEGMLGHSPDGGGVGGGGYGGRYTTAMNETIRRDQHAGIEVTLAALREEAERRRTDREGGT